MSYTLTPSPFTTAETLVVVNADTTRGRELAEALGGRWSHHLKGHLMHASAARRWATLFAAGWRAESSYPRGTKTWTYTLDGRRSYTRTDALKATRDMLEEAKAYAHV